MGFKKLSSNHKHLSNNNCYNNYKIGGLIFDSREDYNMLKNLDVNLKSHVELIKDDCYDMEEFFNRFEKVNVTETYYGAKEELDGLFENATDLIQYEDARYITEYKVGCCFFDKIRVLEYCDSDIDD